MAGVENNGNNNNFIFPWDMNHKADIRQQIKSVIDKLANGEKIDGDNFFLKGYDNGNSVFDTEEIERIKQDYENGVLENILDKGIGSSELSSVDFNDSMLQEELDDWKQTLSQMDSKEFEKTRELCLNSDKINGIDKDQLKQIINLPKDKYDKAVKLIQDENISSELNGYFVMQYVNAPEEVQERALKLLHNSSMIENRPDEQVIDSILILAALNEEDFSKIEDLIFKEKGQPLDLSTILSAVEMNDEDRAKLKELTTNESRKFLDTFSFEELQTLINLPEDEYEKIKPFLNIPDREYQIPCRGLLMISKMSAEEISAIENILVENSNKYKFFGIDEASFLANCTEEQKQRIEKYIADGSIHHFDLRGLSAISEMSADRLKIFDNLVKQISEDRKNGEHGFINYNDIALGVLTTKEESLERFLDFAYIPGKEFPFSAEDYSILLEMDDSQYNEVRGLMNKKFIHKASDLEEYLNLNESSKQYIKDTLAKNPNGYFRFPELIELSKYTDDQQDIISNFEEYLLCNSFNNSEDIKLIANKIKPENIDVTKRLLNTTCLNRDFSENNLENEKFCYKMNLKGNIKLQTAIAIGNLNPSDRDCVMQILESDESINANRAYEIAKLFEFNDVLPDNFYFDHPDFEITHYSPLSETVTIMGDKDCEDTYTYDKQGLLEFRVNNDIDNIATITNVRNNSTQEIKYKYYERLLDVEQEVVSKFDNNNNLIERRTSVPSGIDGIANVSIFRNGKEVPAQFATVDPTSGATIIQKDFTSPLGVRTEMYIEDEPEGVRISSLKITDKNGKVLLNREMTFQQVSENEFVTSLNGNVYRAKFEDNQFTITDEKQGVTIPFDYGHIITDCNNEMIQMLKYVPANQLMAMAKRPVIINRDYDLDNNANASGTTINMGNFNYTDDIKRTLVATFMHEFGHHLDFDPTKGYMGKISDNKELNEIFEKEYKAFVENTTCSQQRYVNYFTNHSGAGTERTAEANMIINGGNQLGMANRALYYQEFFPETIAMEAKLIDELVEKLNDFQ